MKPQLTISHEGTLGQEDQHQFGFHQESIAHIMRVLTDLYENPELAVIREYSNNARDAHIAAGKPEVPIRITAPSMFEQTFIVRDDGVGLSKQELIENLTQYGFSSKRDNDNETGMLGLGSKSALTYTSQFSYVACKDGVTVTVLITRQEDGAPVLQVVNEIETPEESNYVEVHVPVKDSGTFNRKIDKFFWVWEKGTVLVNGEEPESIWDEPDPLDPTTDRLNQYIWLSDDVVLIPGEYSQPAKCSIVQGGVTYRVSADNWDAEIIAALRGWQIYVFVDVGTVDFTPNREAIMETKRTKECLSILGDYVHNRLRPSLQSKLDTMDFKEAHTWVRQRQDLARWMFKKGTPLKWSGRILSFDHSVELPDASVPAWRIDARTSSYGGVDRAEEGHRINFTNPPVAIVSGYKRSGSISQDHKDQIRSGLRKLHPEAMNGTNAGRYGSKILLVNAPLAQSLLAMIGDPPQVAFTDVYEKAAAKKRSSSKALETRYRMVDSTTSGWKEVHELEYHPEAYITAEDFRSVRSRDRAERLSNAGHRVAVLWKRNEKWFAENHPNALEINDYGKWFAETKVPAMIAELGDIGRHRLHQCRDGRCGDFSTWIRVVGLDKISEINDPDIQDVARVIKASQKPSLTVDKITGSRRTLERLGYSVDISVSSTYCERAAEMLNRYPIFRWISPENMRYHSTDELVRVINAVYHPTPVPSTELVLWDSSFNPNHPKAAFPACDYRLVTPSITTHKGVLL